MLAKHPDDRYGSAEALLADLNEIKSSARSTETFGLAAVTDGGALEPTRFKWLSPVSAVLMVLLVAVLVVVLGQR